MVLGGDIHMRQGKELELVIKKIEQVKLPKATINSPEYVRDVDTGTQREVDVGIRYPTPNGEVY